eukprot:3157061-Pleurochrysis_carterae.AAC.1
MIRYPSVEEKRHRLQNRIAGSYGTAAIQQQESSAAKLEVRRLLKINFVSAMQNCPWLGNDVELQRADQ